MTRWNDESLKLHYERVMRYAKADRFKFTDEELEKPYLDKLSHQTKSVRILRMISLAYWLGILEGIREIDGGKTIISPSRIEKITKVGE